MPQDPARSRQRRASRGIREWRAPRAPVAAFAVFAFVVALTGGSARGDIGSLLVLRPVAVLCIVAMLLADGVDWRGVRPLHLLLGLFAATIAIQLVPVPPALWYGIGGREPYDTVARTLGGTRLWHPLAIAPDRAWNSLVSLLVPLGAIIGFCVLDDAQKRFLIWPILGLVVLTMVLGLAQIAGGETSPLYWYRVSGRGQLLGLFANRNHQGAFLALALPLLRAWTLLPTSGLQTGRNRTIIALAIAAVIILYVLVLGSRAGVALTLVGVIAALLIAPSLGFGRLSRRQRWIIAGGIVTGIVALLVLAMNADRAVAIGRFTDGDLSAEGRLAAMPTLLHIIAQTFPVGTGFGSFAAVYATYEPDALLKPTYFNAAHNDLIELTITGGLPALAVLLLFLAWWGRICWRRITSPAPSAGWRALHRAAIAGVVILLLASLVDYPLRTPLMAMVFTILCCWLAYTPQTGGHRARAPSRAEK